MWYKRINVRAPVAAKVKLCDLQNRCIEASSTDVCENGIGLKDIREPLQDAEYSIEVTTAAGKQIEFAAKPVYQQVRSAGLKITRIELESYKSIRYLVSEFQSSEEFISYIEKHHILDDWFFDKDGKEVEISFDVPPPSILSQRQ